MGAQTDEPDSEVVQEISVAAANAKPQCSISVAAVQIRVIADIALCPLGIGHAR